MNVERVYVTMNYKDLLIRFILGGGAVALSYLVTIVSPWEILAGIFAAFPAVMITAVLMVGLSSGSKNAAIVANAISFWDDWLCGLCSYCMDYFNNNWKLAFKYRIRTYFLVR